MDKILVIGNLGYIGPVLIKYLRQQNANAKIIGFDNGYFENCYINHLADRSQQPDIQIHGDVRNLDASCLDCVSSIVYLAAISNDPMGNVFEEQTLDINYRAALKIAHQAKDHGVKSFVYASSCSSYGFGGDTAKSEADDVNPLTAYARSKVQAEIDLKDVASSDFTVTCLRFATACGASPRLRLDLVLNDFVASAVLKSEITILSDGSPLRPLIDVQDMAQAIEWACGRDGANGGDFLTVNAGCNAWNFSVREIAEKVKDVFDGTKVHINEDAEPDKRSYRVDFSLYEKLSGNFYPNREITQTIHELANCIKSSNLDLSDSRSSHLMRLNVLRQLQAIHKLDDNLNWVQ